MKGPSETKLLKKLLHYVIMGDKMSPENQDALQLLKEVNFRRILTFYSSEKWGHFGAFVHGSMRF